MAKTTNDTATAKVDRRKQPRGPRQVNFVCVAQDKDHNPIVRTIPAGSREEAEKKFKSSTKLAPLNVEGPFYQVKGTSATAGRLSVTAPADIGYTNNRWDATLRGYKVLAQGIKAFGDYKADELVLVMSVGPVDPNAKAPRLFKTSEQPIVPFSTLEGPKQL